MDVTMDSQTWNVTVSESILDMQQKEVEELKQKYRDKIQQLRLALNDVLGPSHNDFFLYRWLKGRKFDVGLTEKMIRKNLQWREETQMDRIEKVFEPSEVIKKYAPFGTFGQDKDGRPLIFLTMGRIDYRGIVYSAKIHDIVKYYCLLYEYMERFCKLQSEKLGKVIDSYIVIADYEGLKIQDLLWKPALEVAFSILKCFEANYPDGAQKVFVVNTPKVFSIFWALVKPVLSEVNRKKFKIFGVTGWEESLLEFIDADQLPVHWAGTQVDEIDGNPYCSSKIVLGGTIPKSYYLGLYRRESLANDKLESITLDPKKSLSLDYNVDTPGTTLTWIFGTDEHDIAFGISYRRQNEDENSLTEILPLERRECQYVPEEGTILCDQPGTYVMIFDNSYSWYKSKKVSYDITLQPPPTETETLIERL